MPEVQASRKLAGACSVKQAEATASELSKSEYFVFHVGKSHRSCTHHSGGAVGWPSTCYGIRNRSYCVSDVPVLVYTKNILGQNQRTQQLYGGALLTVSGNSMVHVRMKRNMCMLGMVTQKLSFP